MYLAKLLRNLQRQRPLLRLDGKWDLAIWLDPRGLKSDHSLEVLQRAAALARREGIAVCQDALALAEVDAHTLLVAGHNAGLDQPGMYASLMAAGKVLSRRYLILYSCGKEVRPEIDAVMEATDASGIYEFHRKENVDLFLPFFEALLYVGRNQPELLPTDAVRAAVQRVVAG